MQLEHTVRGWIREGSRVLDLGCGDGRLLLDLAASRAVLGYGLEIDQRGIARCLEAGVNVIEQDLYRGLGNFPDHSFDTVIMTQTLQAVREPRRVLEELLRIADRAIVSFPNFGHWRVRWALLAGGRMPMTGSLPTPWYETQNIHLCTVGDFVDLCDGLNVEIEAAAALAEGKPARSIDPRRFIENWRAETAIFLLNRQTPKDGSSPRQDRQERTDLFD